MFDDQFAVTEAFTLRVILETISTAKILQLFLVVSFKDFSEFVLILGESNGAVSRRRLEEKRS